MSIKPMGEWPPLGRIQKRVRKDPNGCWTWLTESTHPEPRLRYKDRYYSPRRLLWKLVKGGMPGALWARCNNRLCVNPDHFYEKRSTQECSNGHKQTPDNAYVGPRGARVCRLCQRRNRKRQSRETMTLYTKRYVTKNYSDPVRLEEYKQARRDSQRITRIAKKLDKEVAHWSPAANRWLIRDGDRWISGGDNEALIAMNVQLLEYGYSVSKSWGGPALHNEISVTFMRRMKALAERNWRKIQETETEEAA